MEWKFVVEPTIIQNRYQITEDGVVRDTIRDRIIKQHPDRAGYMRIRLATPDKHEQKFFVHRLVATTYLPLPNEGQDQVDHIDGKRDNNHVSNLRWCTRLENIRNPGTLIRKSEAHVIAEESLKRKVICENTGEIFSSMTEAANKFGLSIASVTQSCTKFLQGKPRRSTKFGKPVMHFHLIEDKPVEIKQDSQEVLLKAKKRCNAKAVRCIETGLEYPSVSSAARAYGLRCSSVAGSCNRNQAGGRKSSSFGLRTCYHFEWVTNS